MASNQDEKKTNRWLNRRSSTQLSGAKRVANPFAPKKAKQVSGERVELLSAGGTRPRQPMGLADGPDELWGACPPGQGTVPGLAPPRAGTIPESRQ